MSEALLNDVGNISKTKHFSKYNGNEGNKRLTIPFHMYDTITFKIKHPYVMNDFLTAHAQHLYASFDTFSVQIG